MTRRPNRQRKGAHRALRSVSAIETVPMGMVDQHGFALYLLAHVLSADPEHAERLVVQAVKAQGDVLCDFRELAAAVHVAWSAWGPSPAATEPAPPSGNSSAAQIMSDLHALPDDQRAAIALCRYGDHDYRQAALAMGIPAADLAHLLGRALRTLAVPTARGAEPSPPTFASN